VAAQLQHIKEREGGSAHPAAPALSCFCFSVRFFGSGSAAMICPPRPAPKSTSQSPALDDAPSGPPSKSVAAVLPPV